MIAAIDRGLVHVDRGLPGHVDDVHAGREAHDRAGTIRSRYRALNARVVVGHAVDCGAISADIDLGEGYCGKESGEGGCGASKGKRAERHHGCGPPDALVAAEKTAALGCF